MTTDDMELLRQYARHNSEEAFAALVSRHVNLVYSIALRQTGDAHLAEEITQAVFVILARKAKSLGDRIILAGWLCRTARNVSANALTMQRRRQRREQEAYMQTILNEPANDETWRQIAPLLDAALARLGAKDHDTIVLRFFENKELKQVGAALGVSEDAAKKRVSRALEKLRRFFFIRGVDSTTDTIAKTISINSIQVAPVALAKSVTAVALSKGAAASASTLTLIKGALKIMAWSKAKTAIVAATVVLLTTASVTPYVWRYHLSPDAWHHRFEAVYHLKDGEIIRYIKPPFIPERLTYYRTEDESQAKAIPRGPDHLFLQQDGDELGMPSMGFGYKRYPLRQVLGKPFGFWQYEFDAPAQLLDIDLSGDWTIRKGADREGLLKALEPIILKATGRRIHFEKQTVERDVIVAHGTAKELDWKTKVLIYAEKSKVRGGGMGGGTLQQLLGLVGEQLNIYMVNEAKTAEPEPAGAASFGWNYYPDANSSKMGDRREELTDKVLKNVAAQTELTFTREQRPVEVWFITEQK